MRTATFAADLTDAWPLLELTRDVTRSLDLQDVLDKSLAGLRRLMTFGGGSIQLVQDGGLALVASDPPATIEAYALRVPVGQGVGGRIAETGEALYIPDVATDPRVPPPGRRALSAGVRSYFGVPLIVQGSPIGVVQLDSPDVDGFSKESRTLILALAPAIAAAVQNARLYAHEIAMIEELRATQKMKADFLATISHEFRTPLTTLTGFAQILAERAQELTPEMVTDFGTRMWRAGRWLARMIEDLLDLSQIEQGRLAVACTPVDLTAVVDAVKSAHESDQHPIRLSGIDEMPRAIADDARLKQVLGNLVSNARKFSPPGSTIDLVAERSAERIEIAVVDHGDGIAADELDRIFRAFVQSEPLSTREAGGLGTGLFLVKELCRRMGATVHVNSVVGLGSRFTVSLAIAH